MYAERKDYQQRISVFFINVLSDPTWLDVLTESVVKFW